MWWWPSRRCISAMHNMLSTISTSMSGRRNRHCQEMRPTASSSNACRWRWATTSCTTRPIRSTGWSSYRSRARPTSSSGASASTSAPASCPRCAAARSPPPPAKTWTTCSAWRRTFDRLLLAASFGGPGSLTRPPLAGLGGYVPGQGWGEDETPSAMWPGRHSSLAGDRLTKSWEVFSLCRRHSLRFDHLLGSSVCMVRGLSAALDSLARPCGSRRTQV